MGDAMRWSGSVDVVDPRLGIPVELHVQGFFSGSLPADRQPWLEATLLQLLPHAVTRNGHALIEPDANGIAQALLEQCASILHRRGIEGTLTIYRAWVANEGRERLQAAQMARATSATEGDDPWESTMLSAKSDAEQAVLAARAAAAQGPVSRVGVGCKVLWSDGQRYPGRVLDRREGQVLVEMQDGQSHWIASGYVDES